MARKVVVDGEQILKINEQLNVSRKEEHQKSDDSFKFATEGEETVSFETEQVSSGPKVSPEIISDVATNLKNRFVLVGSIAGVETTESVKVGGKNEKGKEKKSKGARNAVRENGKRVVDSSPTPVSLTKYKGAMVVWGDKSGGVEESVKKTGGGRTEKSLKGLFNFEKM